MLLRDLEEGRSWLHSDKCGVLGGDPARVQEYVQREGEEVGMRWSLASKWTSFIGVEEEIMDVPPIRTPAPPEGDLSALSEGRSSAPFTPSIPAETSAESEDIVTASTSTSSSRFDGIPLPGSNLTHSVPVTIGSESLPRVLRGALVVNSGVDTMSRLLAPRDTPDPTHPIWGRSEPLFYRRPQCGVVPSQGNSYPCSAPTGPYPPAPPNPGLPASHSSAAATDMALHSLPRKSHSKSDRKSHRKSHLKSHRKSHRRPAPDRTPIGPLINIYRLIAAQKFDGSFHIADEYVAELLGSRMDSAPQACGGDKVAWASLLVAVLLEGKYACLRDVWELVVRKIWVFLSSREGVRVEEAKVMAEELVAGWE
ncbi:unnamed protein product [Tuber aestivum]|uniref:Uncharacterized protein n=1 Tax=Tuber aestivum TaxID=59557 RepID=A0A292PQX8_9PEZI|nr:unnamed protein product [Tuber aestivum]